MSVPAGFKGLRFPCECVSSMPDGYSDPWAEITKNKLLPNGTKEEIVNALTQVLKQSLVVSCISWIAFPTPRLVFSIDLSYASQ